MGWIDNPYDSYEEFLVSKAEETKTPITGTFELLPYCNMSCNMCYIQQTPTFEKLHALNDANFWFEVIKQSTEAGMLYLLFTGGETFLYPWFKELYESVYELPIYMVINTNATLLDEKTVKWLSEKPPKRINISLYGASNETYNRLTHNPQGFTQVIKAFDLLKKYNIPFRVHTTLVKENINDYDKFIEICNHYQVPLQMVSYMFPSYRKNNDFGINNGRLNAKEAALMRYKYTKDGYINRDDYIEFVKKSLYFIDHPTEHPIYGANGMVCKGGVCSFWVDYKGNLSACGVMNQNGCDLSQMSFKEAWNKAIDFQMHSQMPLKCQKCSKRSLCPICAAATYCETGNFCDVAKYCCEYTMEYEKMLRKELLNE